MKRTAPLEDVEASQATAEVDFIKLWDSNAVLGWSARLPTNGTPQTSEEGIWCAACQKLYSKQTVYDAHLKSRKHVKNTEKIATSGTENPPSNPNGPLLSSSSGPTIHSHQRLRPFKAALATNLSETILKALHTKLSDTKANVERRFALTSRERELEQSEPQPDAPAPTTTAPRRRRRKRKSITLLNYHSDGDGKPIPYWLYKLHGLGVEYRCEICQDHVYMGR